MPGPGLITSVLMGGNMAGMGFSFYPPLGDKWSRIAYRGDPAKVVPLGDLIQLRVKNRIDEGDFYKWSKENGFDENFADLLRLAQSQYLTGMEYVNLWRRGHITENAVDDHLKHLGLQELDVQLFKKVTEYFPLPGDLVRFAVREVYTPSVVSKFGLMADIPTKYLEEAEKAGLVEEQARNFWAAHWQLPGINQGYEMLQRGEINREELEALFVAADIMPFWREPLLNISYNPFLIRMEVKGFFKASDPDTEFENELSDMAFKTRVTYRRHLKEWLSFFELTSQGFYDTLKEAYIEDPTVAQKGLELLTLECIAQGLLCFHRVGLGTTINH